MPGQTPPQTGRAIIDLPQPLRITKIAEILEGVVEGDGDTEITSVAPPDRAREGSIVFALSPGGEAAAAASVAAAVVAAPGTGFPGKVVIRVDNPRYAMALGLTAAAAFQAPAQGGIHPTAVIEPGAVLGDGVAVGALAYVAGDVRLGAGTVVGPWCVVERDVHIGPAGRLHSNVTIGHGTRIGARVEIHSGTVIGSDGFGYIQKSAVPTEDKHYSRYFQKEEPHFKVPQIGNVVIGDDVEIGANVTVDRGTLDATTIRDGVKIDNHVQIAHNVEIGEHAIIVSQTGVSGHSRIGRHATLGGQAGISEGVVIGDGALIGASCGIAPGKRVPPHTAFAGWAGRPADKHLRLRGAIAVLPRTTERLRALEREVAALREALARRDPEAVRPADS